MINEPKLEREELLAEARNPSAEERADLEPLDNALEYLEDTCSPHAKAVRDARDRLAGNLPAEGAMEREDLIHRVRYRVGNPSAWDAYDEGASELFRECLAALSPPIQDERQTESECRMIAELREAMPADPDDDQTDAMLAVSPYSPVGVSPDV